MYFSKLKPFIYLGLFYGIVSLLVRIIFIFHPITTVEFGFFESLKILFVGALSDLFVLILSASILAIYFLFLSEGKYKNPYGYIIFALFVLAFIYTAFVPGNIFRQYGGSFPEVAMIFIGVKTFIFGLMLFLPTIRRKIRNVLYFIILFLYVLLIIFNAVSEYFFWNEFGVRYNFIAVDYLIYTNEVIGNIMESYPVAPLFSAIVILATLLTYFIYLRTKNNLLHLPTIYQKLVLLVTYSVLFGLSLAIIPEIDKVTANNTFAKEIQSNGFPKFYEAFTQNELDYFRFYPVINQQFAEHNFLKQFQPSTLERNISANSSEIHKNVVLISVESLSAEFLQHYGNEQKIMPFLDSLADKSFMFTNLYATGNRTVRGLEALTLCIPPTAGESVVKRANNQNKFSSGSVFKSKGYKVKFLYGGYSYFDNMESFFQGNGYEIIDRNNFKTEEITFANVWGVSDEDMAKKAVQTMNKDAASGKPFFHHWMTVSNHRPFTYPEGRIDIPGTAKSRDGGVKYTDYALRKFFAMAKKETWYKNTVFIIVADHCASSAGKTELPLDKYRIPGIVFSEGFIQPQKFNKTVSQIDIMPTIFGILNFNYNSKFLGQNVLDPNFQPKAYIATYEDLGLIKDDFLTVISPTKKVKQYAIKHQKSDLPDEFSILYEEKLLERPKKNLVEDCISAYQSVSYWLKENKLNK